MRERVRRYAYFAITIAAVVIVLKTLNRLPLLLQQGTLRTYNSVEAVRAKLNIRDVRVPTYFPQNVRWPPDEIWAQTQPYIATLMVFRREGTSGPALVISQVASGRPALDDRIKILQVKESVPYDLKGRDALLKVGVCEHNEVCSSVSWNEENSAITVTMKSSPFELLQIAKGLAP
jgi:hypothetical protein